MSDADASRPHLLRVLGIGTGIALVVGQVIGSGIFVKPGIIARELGDFRLILVAWLVGGVLCLLGGLCIAELAAMLPRAGGLYVYLREAYGPLPGFLFGWNEVYFNRPAASGALAIIFAGSMTRVCGWETGPMANALVAAVLIVVLAWLNIRGVRSGGSVQVGTAAVKAGFIALIALLPFVLLAFGRPSFSVANWATTQSPASDANLLTRFGIVMLAVMWAYNGWHAITPVAEEIRRPERNVPLALLSGIGALIVLYVGVNLAYHGVLPMAEIAASGEHAAETVVERLLGPVGGALMAAVLMCSTLGGINGDLLLAPRISFAMGRDGVFFRRLAVVHPKYHTPANAIAVQAGMSIGLVVLTGMLVQFVPRFSQTSIFDLLTNFVIFAASIFYVLAVLALPILRWRKPELARPYRIWGSPVLPLVFVGVYVWFLSEVYRSRPFESQSGLILIALGVLVYYAYAARNPRPSETVAALALDIHAAEVPSAVAIPLRSLSAFQAESQRRAPPLSELSTDLEEPRR